MRHTKDETELILSALVCYRQNYIVSLATADNPTENDKKVLQSEIDRINALLLKYGY